MQISKILLLFILTTTFAITNSFASEPLSYYRAIAIEQGIRQDIAGAALISCGAAIASLSLSGDIDKKDKPIYIIFGAGFTGGGIAYLLTKGSYEHKYARFDKLADNTNRDEVNRMVAREISEDAHASKTWRKISSGIFALAGLLPFASDDLSKKSKWAVFTMIEGMAFANFIIPTPVERYAEILRSEDKYKKSMDLGSPYPSLTIKPLFALGPDSAFAGIGVCF